MRLRPRLLAEYSAVSASRSSCSAVCAPRSQMATPTLADTTTSRPSTRMGSDIAARMRTPMAASEASAAPGCRITISSPPKRLTVSPCPTQS